MAVARSIPEPCFGSYEYVEEESRVLLDGADPDEELCLDDLGDRILNLKGMIFIVV